MRPWYIIVFLYFLMKIMCGCSNLDQVETITYQAYELTGNKTLGNITTGFSVLSVIDLIYQPWIVEMPATEEDRLRENLITKSEDQKWTIRQYNSELRKLESHIAESKEKDYQRKQRRIVSPGQAAWDYAHEIAKPMEDKPSYGPSMWSD